MSIWISREHPLFNFERLDMWCAWIGQLSEKLLAFEFFQSFRCSILSVSICDAPKFDLRVKSSDHLNLSRAPIVQYRCDQPESHIRVKSYDHSKFSRFSVVQFRASLYSKRLNRTSVWEVMTIWISRKLPFFNFEHLDILSAWIGLPTEKLWPFEFLESFRCSISSVSICDAPESDIRLKSYDHLNLFIASVV